MDNNTVRDLWTYIRMSDLLDIHCQAEEVWVNVDGSMYVDFYDHEGWDMLEPLAVLERVSDDIQEATQGFSEEAWTEINRRCCGVIAKEYRNYLKDQLEWLNKEYFYV